MTYNLKNYFNKINVFFLLLICILATIDFFLNLPSAYIYIFCFLLIATVGVSHGAYDGKKVSYYLIINSKIGNLFFILLMLH